MMEFKLAFIMFRFHSVAGMELFFFVIHCDKLEQITRRQLHSRTEQLGFSPDENPNLLQNYRFYLKLSHFWQINRCLITFLELLL